MSTARPVRQAKKNAIANIKKCIADMNTYDDNGVFYTDAMQKKVTLSDVIEKYETSTFEYKFYALLPSICIEYLDNRENGYEFYDDIITDLSDSAEPHHFVYTEESMRDFQEAISFYDNHTDEAKKYVLDKSEDYYVEMLQDMFPELREDDEDDDDEDDY